MSLCGKCAGKLAPCKVTAKGLKFRTVLPRRVLLHARVVCACVRQCNTLHVITKDRPHARVRRKARNNFFSRDECASRKFPRSRNSTKQRHIRLEEFSRVAYVMEDHGALSREFSIAILERRLVLSSLARGTQMRFLRALWNQYVAHECNKSSNTFTISSARMN